MPCASSFCRRERGGGISRKTQRESTENKFPSRRVHGRRCMFDETLSIYQVPLHGAELYRAVYANIFYSSERLHFVFVFVCFVIWCMFVFFTYGVCAQVLSTCRHENIVPLLGVCMEPPCLVYRLMPNNRFGTALRCLRSCFCVCVCVSFVLLLCVISSIAIGVTFVLHY